MVEKHSLLHPYKFTSRVVMIMISCVILATLVSFAFSYYASESDMHNDIIAAQSVTAVYMMELSSKTSLPIDNMISMAATDSLTIRRVVPDQLPLTAEQMTALQDEGMVTITDEQRDLPMTFVMLGKHIVCISVNEKVDSFSSILFRFFFQAAWFVSIFLLMSLLASRVIGSPIAMLTKATRKVADGDFNVHLPERANGEVGELMRSFNSMTDALGKTAYLQKDFISSVSHEFKTPIASIKGYATLLKIPDLDEESRQEYVEMIARESDRLSNLSKTLLRLASLEQQMTPATLSTFRLDEQIRQVILSMVPIWDARGFEWKLEMDEVSVTSDEELLNQVWVNLIQNALKFSSDNSTITINVTAGENNACVEIIDQGPGMDEATTERIFDRFYQADKSRSKEGVGLGLSIVKRIIDILGCQIHVCSKANEGSTFIVHVPNTYSNMLKGG